MSTILTEIVMGMYSFREFLEHDLLYWSDFAFTGVFPNTNETQIFRTVLIQPEEISSIVCERVSPGYIVSIAKETRLIIDLVKKSYEFFDMHNENNTNNTTENLERHYFWEIFFLKQGYAPLNLVTVSNRLKFKNHDHEKNSLSIHINLESKTPDEEFKDIQNYFIEFTQNYNGLYLLKHETTYNEYHKVCYKKAIASQFLWRLLERKKIASKNPVLLFDQIKLEFKEFIPR